MKTTHFIFSGKAQGVFFRVSAQTQARKLELAGWVRNLSDGRVEGVVSGKPEAFQLWLAQGPERAVISKLEVSEIELQEFAGFEIR